MYTFEIMIVHLQHMDIQYVGGWVFTVLVYISHLLIIISTLEFYFIIGTSKSILNIIYYCHN